MAPSTSSSLFDEPADVIREAAKSPRGIIALAILVLAFLSFKFFEGESLYVRMVIFGAMFAMAAFASILAMGPALHPTNRPSSSEGTPQAYPAYGLKYRKVIWRHTYLRDRGFQGEIETFVENVSSTNISVLPPQQGSWFGWSLESLSLKFSIHGNDEGKYSLQRILFSQDKIVRRDIDGSDQRVTVCTWQYKVEPSFPPEKSLHYSQLIETKNSEQEAFSEKGSFAGMTSLFPVDVLSSEMHAPEGYRFIDKGFTVRDYVGIDVKGKVEEPEFSSDGSRIQWTITNPIPTLKYYVRIVIVKRNR